MSPQSTTAATVVSMKPYFDAREQTVSPKGSTVPPPVTEDSKRQALADLHKQRMDLIVSTAETNIPAALRMLIDFYDGSNMPIFIFAQLSIEQGPATVYNHLINILVERKSRR